MSRPPDCSPDESPVTPGGAHVLRAWQDPLVERRAASQRSRAVPEEIRQRFVARGSSYHFPDGTLAFRDKGRTLVTPSENSEVVRSMLAIAQTRGWRQVQVQGSARFRRRAWEAGAELGINVVGYEPTPVDREPSRPRRHPAREGSETVASAPSIPSELGRARARSADQAHARPNRTADPELVTGMLLEHGVARYEFKSDRDESYYVKLQQGDRIRTLWGKDLQRAIREGATHAQIGDAVGARSIGRAPVTVRERVVDERTGEVLEREKTAHRHRWVVERSRYWEQLEASARTLRDASLSPERAAQAQPELKDAFLHLKHAQLLAQRLPDEASRGVFVTAVREGLARALENGAPLAISRVRVSPRQPSAGEDRTDRAPMQRARGEAAAQR